jgi:hypothetical protein
MMNVEYRDPVFIIHAKADGGMEKRSSDLASLSLFLSLAGENN